MRDALARQYDACVDVLERIERAGRHQSVSDILGLVSSALASVDAIEAEERAKADAAYEAELAAEPIDILGEALGIVAQERGVTSFRPAAE